MIHPSSRRPAALFGAGVLLAALLIAGAFFALRSGAAPSQSQMFFRTKLLEDSKTSKAIRDLLSKGGGMVDPSIAFRDLTGDGRTDAIVRVQSNTASGAVALYVFSTDGARDGSELRAIYRQQLLLRASTKVRKTVLSFRTASYEPGDEVCCPSKETETALRWDKKGKRFRIASRKDIEASPTPTPTPTPTATP